jgi:hypothetical protein
MPINLNKAANEAATSGFLDRIGTTGQFETLVAKNLLEQYGAEFKLVLTQYIKEKQLIGSGALSDNIKPQISEDGKTLTISLLDYYDYINKGVKGKGPDAKNGLDSPYFFKNYGMNKEGRDSIKKYILSGKAKVRNIRNDRAAGIGLESKAIRQKPKKSLLDSQVDNLIYMIKKYGIKKTNYFDDAVNIVFANWAVDMAAALGEDIKLNLRITSNKKY